MPTFTFEQLQSYSGGTWLGGRAPRGEVTGFTQDSRQLREGMCFVALKTAQRDGHAFLPAALEAGAAMALVSKPDTSCALPQLVVADVLAAFQQIARQHRLSFKGKVVGVTGSCGKTSTKNILRTLLGEGCHATEGNLNNFIGVPLTLLGLETDSGKSADENTGADAAAATCPTEGAHAVPQFAVVEAGISEPGEMAVLASMIQPDIAVVTMVGAAHLQDLGSVEGVAAEKAVLAHAVAAAASARLPLLFAPLECFAYPAFATLQNKGVAVAPKEEEDDSDYFQWVFPEDVRGDENDEYRRKMTEISKEDREVSKREAAALLAALPAGVMLHRYDLDYLSEEQREGESGAAVILSIEGERLCGHFPLSFIPSSGMASNLALALIAAHTLGVPADLLAQRILDWQPQGNRGSWKTFRQQRFFVDCYNANPASMQDSLMHFSSPSVAQSWGAQRPPCLYVIGGMRELGAESAKWHKQVGVLLGIMIGNVERGDAVVSIGEAVDNAALEAGIRIYASSLPVHSFTRTADAREMVAAFRGDIFLKGSRFYALESLLPEETTG